MGRQGKGRAFTLVEMMVVVAIVDLEQRPDLELWHTVELEGEFDRKSAVDDFAGTMTVNGVISGSGNIKARSLTNRDSDVHISGSGSASSPLQPAAKARASSRSPQAWSSPVPRSRPPLTDFAT